MGASLHYPCPRLVAMIMMVIVFVLMIMVTILFTMIIMVVIDISTLHLLLMFPTSFSFSPSPQKYFNWYSLALSHTPISNWRNDPIHQPLQCMLFVLSIKCHPFSKCGLVFFEITVFSVQWMQSGLYAYMEIIIPYQVLGVSSETLYFSKTISKCICFLWDF